MKQKLQILRSQAGFTLVELLVVLAIMTLIMGALVIDFNSQRGRRNIVLAKNETITNLRKVQSYMLSSRNIEPGVPAKYYIVTFDTSSPTTYQVQAVDSDYKFYEKVETISLPASVKISDIKIVNADTKVDPRQESVDGGDIIQPTDEEGETTKGTSYNCMQIIFSAPFGKMYTNAAEECSSDIANVLKDPVQVAAISEKTARIYFSDDNDSAINTYIELVPPTGQMSSY